MKQILQVYVLSISILFLFTLASFGQNTRVWATYYGGDETETAESVATDLNGNVYLAGNTDSKTSIALGGFQNVLVGGQYDCFLAKFDANGTRLWATYYGGNKDDKVGSVATDKAGNVYLVGETSSDSGFASGGFQNTYGGGQNDAFLVKFDAAGNRLWATYYGGAATDIAKSVVIDTSGNIFMVGYSNSYSGIAQGGYDNSNGGKGDAFLVKFDASGNRIWGTYYGGAEYEDGKDVALDASGNIYLGGLSETTVGIASGGHQNTYGGTRDGLLVKFDASGNRLWATYYGGDTLDYVRGVGTDAAGNVYISGYTSSKANISSAGAHQLVYGGGVFDAYIAKFNSAGVRQWGTYYGGTNNDYALEIAVDANGVSYIAGDSYSKTGIAFGGFQNSLISAENEFLASFDTNGKIKCATYYGNSHDEFGKVAIDTFGYVYLIGWTAGLSGLSSNGHQNTMNGKQDGYLVKFNTCSNTSSMSASITPTSLLCKGVCKGTAKANVVGGSGGYTYNWSNGQTTQTASNLCAGTYTVTITDGLGTKTTATTIITEPTAITIVLDPTSICKGESYNLTPQINGGTPSYTYSWDNGASTQKDYAVSPSTTTTYNLKVTDNNGCTKTSSTLVTVITLNKPSLTDTSICLGDSVMLSAMGSYQYVWYDPVLMDTIKNSSIMVKPNVNTAYMVITKDANGCSRIDTVNVVIAPAVVSDFSVDPNELAFISQEVCFNNTSINSSKWLWYIDALDTTNGQNPCYTFADSGTFCIQLIAMNNAGCKDTSVKCIDVIDPSILISIPNIFTPNNDGFNDQFIITKTGVTDIRCELYNRWGVLVYSWTELDGTWNGKDASEGTYYYIVEGHFLNESSFKKRGFVQLLR